MRIGAIVRVTGLAKNTHHGQASIDRAWSQSQYPTMRSAVQDDQTREISSFYDSKAKNVPIKYEGVSAVT
jgi:hypothetical protein